MVAVNDYDKETQAALTKTPRKVWKYLLFATVVSTRKQRKSREMHALLFYK
jgi:hypothetical protein